MLYLPGFDDDGGRPATLLITSMLRHRGELTIPVDHGQQAQMTERITTFLIEHHPR